MHFYDALIQNIKMRHNVLLSNDQPLTRLAALSRDLLNLRVQRLNKDCGW